MPSMLLQLTQQANAAHKNVLCVNAFCLLTAEYLSVNFVVKWRLENVAGYHAGCEKGVKAHLNN